MQEKNGCIELNSREVQGLLNNIGLFCDRVRVVEPETRREVNFDQLGEITWGDECFRIFHRDRKCVNCMCEKACETRQRQSRFEMFENFIYHVVSVPSVITLSDGTAKMFILESLEKRENVVLSRPTGACIDLATLLSNESKVYIDSLTEAYNRRYYEERIFLSKQKNISEIAFVMLDVKNFKRINDTYGHHVGDQVLTKSVRAIKHNLRSTDEVIRIGGDEFLIILRDCPERAILRIIKNIREDLKEMAIYDPEKNQSAVLNFGYSYSDHFEWTDNEIEKLYKEADQNMYLDKKQNDS